MNRRSVEAITWFDPPGEIYKKIETSPKDYSYKTAELQARDRALSALVYCAAARITEVVGGPVMQSSQIIGNIPGLACENVIRDSEYLYIRQLHQIKVKTFIRAGQKIPISSVDEYPYRVEIPIPRYEGSLSSFAPLIEDHLDNVGSGPLFKITREYAGRIITKRSGGQLWPHYLRDQGLRFWYRVFHGDPFRLKRFSGHRQWSSLEKYMREFTQADLERLKVY